MATVKHKECLVNGEEIAPLCVDSDPEFFEIKIRSDMSENKKGGEQTDDKQVGYWVFLEPLPRVVIKSSSRLVSTRKTLLWCYL